MRIFSRSLIFLAVIFTLASGLAFSMHPASVRAAASLAELRAVRSDLVAAKANTGSTTYSPSTASRGILKNLWAAKYGSSYRDETPSLCREDRVGRELELGLPVTKEPGSCLDVMMRVVDDQIAAQSGGGGGTNTPAGGNSPGGGGGGGGAVNGGGGAPAEPQYSQGAIVAAGPSSPGDYANEALDTGNFLESERYSWAADVWQTMRQMSNILIVVFLFIGALATTLNYNLNTYGVKRIIPSVVQAAIISNFSYILINVLIEVVGITQQGLLGLGVSNTSVSDSTWSQLAAPLRGILDNIQPNKDTTAGGLIWGLIAALAVAFAMLLLWITVGILYLRATILSLLICFAPLAILSMALPATQGIWKKWWEEFAKWLFIPLIVCFWLMVAAVIAGIAALPLYLQMIVMMFAIWQGVKAPFSFKPAVMGAAIGAATGYIAGAGRSALNTTTGAMRNSAGYWGQRALNGDHLVGNLNRARRRRVQWRQDQLTQAQDTSVVWRGNSERAARLNAGIEARDMGVQRGKVRLDRMSAQARGTARRTEAGTLLADEELAKKEAEAGEGAAKSLSSRRAATRNRARMQRIEELQIEKEQHEANEEQIRQRAAQRALEANPERMREIAALNMSTEAVKTSIEALRTGYKGLVAAQNQELVAQKQLAEEAKKKAETNLQRTENAFRNSALTDPTSSQAQALQRAVANNPAVRQMMNNLGIHNLAANGSNVAEFFTTAGLDAEHVQKAAERSVENARLNQSRADMKYYELLHDNNSALGQARDATTIHAELNNVEPALRSGAAGYVFRHMYQAVGPEALRNIGVNSEDDLVRNPALLAQSIAWMRGRTANLPPAAGNLDPQQIERLRMQGSMLGSINRGQSNMVRAKRSEAVTTLKETITPEGARANMLQAVTRTGIPEATAMPQIASAIWEHESREGHLTDASGNVLQGPAHHQALAAFKEHFQYLREAALTGDEGGRPSRVAADQLAALIDEVAGSLPAGTQRAALSTRASEIRRAATAYQQAAQRGDQRSIQRAFTTLKQYVNDESGPAASHRQLLVTPLYT